MKLIFQNLLSVFLLACLSQAVSAMSLGDGQITSRVGEPFSANISFVGAYDKDAKFYQVKSSECRSSLIGSTTAGCDSVYEGRLTFFIKKRPDGQYFLRVAGERSESLFYRVIIKYKSPSSGLVYKTFDFLPEFKSGNDATEATSDDDDVTVNTSVQPKKYVVIMGNVIEMPGDIEDKPAPHEPEKASPAKSVNLSIEAKTADAKPADSPKQKRASPDASNKQAPKVKRQTNKAAAPELMIKKEGSYADEIIALQKENEAIGQQIALLEKQIALLKKVENLKAQAGASSVPAQHPVLIPAQTIKQPDDSGIPALNWILIAIVLLLMALLFFLYRKQKKLFHMRSLAEFKPAMVSPTSSEDSKYLDLINEFPRK
ncbi:MAG: hypothetical protein Q7J84_18820 [Sulfuricaulis sp.]|nr:hypothetical protein [Sulfuricaulis sp.]